jgi:hypothetical protein
MKKITLILSVVFLLGCNSKPQSPKNYQIPIEQAEQNASKSKIKTDTVLFNIPINQTNHEVKKFIMNTSYNYDGRLGLYQCYVRKVGFEFSNNGEVCFCIPTGSRSYTNIKSVDIKDYSDKITVSSLELMRLYLKVMENLDKQESELYSLEFDIYVLNENNELTEISEFSDNNAYTKLKDLMTSFFVETFPNYYHEVFNDSYISFDNNIKYSLNYNDVDKQLDLTIENLHVWEEYNKKNNKLDEIEKDTLKSNPFR